MRLQRVRSLKEEFKKIDPSFCTESQIGDALGKIDIGIRQMLRDLEALVRNNYHNHKWHQFSAIEETMACYECAVAGIRPCLVSFAEMLYWCHDIGRLFEGCCVMTENNAVAVPITYENHGLAAVHIVLRRLAVEMVIGTKARDIFDYAVSHHHDLILPEISAGADEHELAKDFFARLVRDLDMMGGLIRKTKGWLEDLDKRRSEMTRYGISGECKMVMPCSVLEDFAGYLPINVELVKHGGSWEAYQLSHLAWIFNISFRETLEILVREGVIEKYLEYFAQQLGENSEEYYLIRDTVRRYFDLQEVAHGF